MPNLLKSFKSLEALVILLFIACLAFEDSILQATPLGYAGAALSVIPLLLLIACNGAGTNTDRTFIIYLIYATAISLVFCILYQDKSAEILLDRAGRAFLLYTFYVYTFLYFKRCHLDIRFPVLLLSILTLLSIVMSMFSATYLNDASILHYSETRNFRPRGFSLEASTYGYLVVSTALLLGWLFRLNIYLTLAAAVTCSALVQSKGAISAISISLLLFLIFNKRQSIYLKLILLVLLGVASTVVLPIVSALYLSDLDNYTSIATRSTMALVSLLSTLSSPLGHGFTGALPYINDNGDHAIAIIKQILPMGLNFSEVSEYFKEGAYKSVSAKSLLFDSIIYFGVPFIVFVIRQVRSKPDSYSPHREILFIFTLLSLAFYIPGVGSYISAMALGLCLNKNNAFLPSITFARTPKTSAARPYIANR